MIFTALHRALGAPPGPLTTELLDAAVQAGVAETADLDWKSALPPAKGLPQTDFPKDLAAMANSGGGVIVFGVRESNKAATGRVDVGDFDEAYERSLLAAAINAISPPVFGVRVHVLGEEGPRAVIVEVPASIDGPHLIYRGEYFGAPVRNDAQTVWMRERQIEVMYRARFDERRRSSDALVGLFEEAARGRATSERAWLIGVARPRVPGLRAQLTRDEARSVLVDAAHQALTFASRDGVHPLENVDRLNPRPGLQRWVAANAASTERSMWREAWASVHRDGAVTIAAAVGGHQMSRDGSFDGSEVQSTALECGVADLLALVRETAALTGDDEYDVRVGIEWSGAQPLRILTVDNMGYSYGEASTPLHAFTPVDATVNARASQPDFEQQLHDLALDCVNQGGLHRLRLIQPPLPEETA